jgi:predicted RNase H-like HicB family nuclease
MILTAILTQEVDGGYVATNPETGTTTQGDTFQEALENLKEATELYLEEFPVSSKAPSLMTTVEVAYA